MNYQRIKQTSFKLHYPNESFNLDGSFGCKYEMVKQTEPIKMKS